MKRSAVPPSSDSFKTYLSEIGRYPLLTAEEEKGLARAYAQGDVRAADRLVTANLRFVVKVASEYRSYGFAISDLVQEGNLGLLKAVQKFDPSKETRFISYAVWWIRAYIQNYVLKSFSLVKLGTTQAQRKLFFSLARTKRELDRASAGHGADSDGEDLEKVARKLGVKPAEVAEMGQRMGGRDASLDAPVGDDGDLTHLDLLASDAAAQEDELAGAQERYSLKLRVGAALSELDRRERYIVEHRVMSDQPVSLQEIGEHFSFSRERARQIEVRAGEKLKKRLGDVAVQAGWPMKGTPYEARERAAA
jgi:RNA polymerase sigma-32 factor